MIFDRLYGILALGGLVAAGLVALTAKSAGQTGTSQALFPLAFIAMLAGGYLLAPRILKLDFVKKRLFSDKGNEDYLALWGKGWAGILAICLSVGIHTCNVGLVMSCAWLIGYNEISFLTWLSIAPLSFLVNQIPLTPGGIGLGETSLFSGLAQVTSASNPGALIFLIFRITFFSVGALGYLLPGSRISRKDLEAE